jgi:hypothetical protein
VHSTTWSNPLIVSRALYGIYDAQIDSQVGEALATKG